MVERLIPNQHVVGSSPTWPATPLLRMPFAGIPEEALTALREPAPALTARLDAAFDAAGADVAARGRVLEYGRLLLAANTRTNLTGARDWYDLIEAHLEDCVRALALVPDGLVRFADWGSGGGLPGLVWAALRPEWTLHLCERNGKKAEFLAEAARRLGLAGVRVHARQFQEVVKDLRPAPQAAVARAVEPLARMLPKLAATRLPLLWMAGPSGEQEFWALPAGERARWSIETLGGYALAESRGARALLRIRLREAAA